ncbi:enoyl-CoA hydratase/carnithine racemase [Stella humosa]|uniref:Enoyl-CoA hydratase domain-containing protein 3, mitochondrial n=1 Tax=Stella humosa TaxID=94 RepID=A0A3N1MDF7_9PROT|nr:enoyl-CoA hydratase [Stella humosa]ROQ01753.1 enoyl-CoA hydratase/carnithine racemase [Stella humosa]BBK32136.1 enoyl-CoA hydratase [Stella humosa]
MLAPVSQDEPLLLREDRAGVARLTLNRPAARNALSVALMAELADVLDEIADDAAVKVVVIAASGPAFCAGHDLKEVRADSSRAAMEALFRQCSDLMLQVTRLPKPVIAEVHAMATAAGCQLVATCDLAVAADTARFATPGVNIGLFCSTPMVALTRNIGAKPAMAMLLTGEPIDAATALGLGLVNRVVPAAGLRAAVDGLADTIASKSPLVLAIGKEAFHRQRDMPLADAYAYASDVMTKNMMAADAAEGIDAFVTRRTPAWKGC